MTNMYQGGDKLENLFRDVIDHESRTTTLEAALAALALRVTALEGLEAKRKAADKKAAAAANA
jgi:hypothetical protein